MAANQTLTLWAKLLVAEYGLNRVIAALAQAEDTQFEEIEHEVEALRKRKSTKRRRRPKTLGELMKEANLDTDVHALVNEIGCAYQNKRYLPELWAVKRFLASHGVEAGNLRSRSAALPMVIGILRERSVNELMEIAAASKRRTKGDLGIIAEQILGDEGHSASTGQNLS